MAQKKAVETFDAPAPTLPSDFAQQVGAAIASGIQQTSGPRKIKPAEYLQSRKKPELDGDYYQNGFAISERFLSREDIALLQQLTPGIYLDGFVTVSAKTAKGGRKTVSIEHPDRKDDRMFLKGLAPNFTRLLMLLIDEAKAQRAQKKAEARQLLADDAA